MVNKILKVAQRDYIETIKTRTFLISIMLTPVLVAAIIFISIRLQKESFSGPRPPRNLAVMNLSNEIAADLDSLFAQYNESHPQRKIILKHYSVEDQDFDGQTKQLKEDVREGKFDAYLLIEKGVLENRGKASFYTRNVTDFEFSSTVWHLVNDTVFNTRYRIHNLSPKLIAELHRRVPMDEVDLSAKSEKRRDRFAMSMMPFFFLMFMFFGIFTTNQGFLMSLIEEKSSRVIEVLLSAVTPFQLMAGKILGQSAVGLTLICVYGFAAYVTATYRGMNDVLSVEIAIYFIIYFVLGFVLISSVFAAIGSACNTVKEAQSLMGPIMIFVIIPMVAWFYITQHPEGTLAIVLSFIPTMTPMVMILRIAARPDLSPFQIFASIALLAVSVPVVIWISAKIFRTGILMYGKPPTMRELLHWLRYD